MYTISDVSGPVFGIPRLDDCPHYVCSAATVFFTNNDGQKIQFKEMKKNHKIAAFPLTSCIMGLCGSPVDSFKLRSHSQQIHLVPVISAKPSVAVWLLQEESEADEPPLNLHTAATH